MNGKPQTKGLTVHGLSAELDAYMRELIVLRIPLWRTTFTLSATFQKGGKKMRLKWAGRDAINYLSESGPEGRLVPFDFSSSLAIPELRNGEMRQD